MRIFFITLLFLIICPLAGVSFADEKSDCLNSCANDKRANDMYCPPAGGFTDEEHKNCIVKNTTEFNSCSISCSPSVSPPADLEPSTTQSPAKPIDDSRKY